MLVSYGDIDLVEIDYFTENEEAIIMCQIETQIFTTADIYESDLTIDSQYEIQFTFKEDYTGCSDVESDSSALNWSYIKLELYSKLSLTDETWQTDQLVLMKPTSLTETVKSAAFPQMYSDNDELEIYLDFGQLPYVSDMFSGQYLES